MDKRYLPEKIETDRIMLKKHSFDLAQQMFDYVDEDRERLSRFLPWPIHTKTVEDEIAFIEKCMNAWEAYEGANYGIYRTADDEYMGNVGTFNFDWDNESCEIGYWILGKFEGKGYMRDSVRAVEKELFSAGFNRIVIMCETENIRSKNIPLSLGYTYEGLLREYKKANDRYVNLEVYSKLVREYKTN